MRTVRFAFDCLDRVLIDGDPDLVGVVTGLCVEVDRITYRVEWFTSGATHAVWFDAPRLRAAPRDDAGRRA